MDTHRIEFMFVESGSVICLLARGLGGLTPTEFLAHWQDADPDGVDLTRDGFFMSPELYQDDSFIVRVVLDDLTQQESTEWVARARGRLNLTDGELIVCSAYDWYGFRHWDTNLYPRMRQAEPGSAYQTTTYIRINPGLYRATIYNYLPDDLSDSGMHDPDQDRYASPIDARIAYFQQTRPGEPLPPWLSDDGSDQFYIDFVLHLEPVDQVTFDSLPLTDPHTDFGWEFRRPDKCPLGIVADTQDFVDADDYDKDD
ncbi:MAG: hypothetical protein K8I30_14740 [Anaerolineae bacterium]|nr:hypothetical protein [Anaerolineae bacterium]